MTALESAKTIAFLVVGMVRISAVAASMRCSRLSMTSRDRQAFMHQRRIQFAHPGNLRQNPSNSVPRARRVCRVRHRFFVGAVARSVALISSMCATV